MTPLQFAQIYKNLEVPFEDGPIKVRVACYRSGVHSSKLLAKAKTLVDQKDESYGVTVRTIHGQLDYRVYDRKTKNKLIGTSSSSVASRSKMWVF